MGGAPADSGEVKLMNLWVEQAKDNDEDYIFNGLQIDYSKKDSIYYTIRDQQLIDLKFDILKDDLKEVTEFNGAVINDIVSYLQKYNKYNIKFRIATKKNSEYGIIFLGRNGNDCNGVADTNYIITELTSCGNNVPPIYFDKQHGGDIYSSGRIYIVSKESVLALISRLKSNPPLFM